LLIKEKEFVITIIDIFFKTVGLGSLVQSISQPKSEPYSKPPNSVLEQFYNKRNLNPQPMGTGVQTHTGSPTKQNKKVS